MSWNNLRILAALALVAAAPAAAQNFNARKFAISGSYTTSIASIYQPSMGFLIGSGPVHQDLLSVSASNLLRKNDSLTAFGWDNYDFGDKNFHEWDAGIEYDMPISKSAKVRADYQHWSYPSGLLGTTDNVVMAGLDYSFRKVNLSADGRMQVTGPHSRGKMFSIRANRKHELFKQSLGKRGYGLSLRHGPEYSHSKGFFGLDSPMDVRYDAILALSRGRYALNFQLRPQRALNPEIKQHGESKHWNAYWNFSLSRSF
jgi:hypothetical protein